MSTMVLKGATLKCTMGDATGSLEIPTAPVTSNDTPTATINDFTPIKNIPTFGMCMSMANPQVASATAAAQGVLTKMPCMPVTVAPWSPGSSIATSQGIKVLTANSTCNCNWAGTISIVDAKAPTIQTD